MQLEHQNKGKGRSNCGIQGVNVGPVVFQPAPVAAGIQRAGSLHVKAEPIKSQGERGVNVIGH